MLLKKHVVTVVINHNVRRINSMGRIKKLKIGKLLKVVKGTPEKQDAKWLETGDIVEIIGIYDHIIMVQKLKKGLHGTQMRQCYPITSLHLNLSELDDIKENNSEEELYDSELWEKVRRYST